jgi:glycosyltransferase involved in cell wall biosynthesis
MIGQLGYEPNLEGAFYFTERIFPLVRERVPKARLRLVGRYRREEDVAWLRQQPGVTVVGEVDEVTPELAAADVVVVPLRFGGGTRIKTLEAFAHRRPVVTTDVGREGIDAVDGTHLLVADGVADFASACVQVIDNPALAASLAESGHELWRSRYSWESIRPRLRKLVVDVTSQAAGTRQMP